VGGIETRSNAVRRGHKPRGFVAAENRLLREALSRMLLRAAMVEVVELTWLSIPDRRPAQRRSEHPLALVAWERNED